MWNVSDGIQFSAATNGGNWLKTTSEVNGSKVSGSILELKNAFIKKISFNKIIPIFGALLLYIFIFRLSLLRIFHFVTLSYANKTKPPINIIAVR